MSEEFDFSTGMPSEDMAQYLQMYLDETAEQLDALVETLLVLEGQPSDASCLNEAFRLIHSIKGSSGMMGLDGITVLTHHLENHFERLRSGLQGLDQSSMGLVLRCIDFLRDCNGRLRQGNPLGSAPELLEELGNLTSRERLVLAAGAIGEAPDPTESRSAAAETPGRTDRSLLAEQSAASISPTAPAAADNSYLITIRFEADLALADLKAELVLARLSEIGIVRDSRPIRAELASVAESRSLQVLLATDRSATEVRIEVDVDGVELIEIEAGGKSLAPLTRAVPGAMGVSQSSVAQSAPQHKTTVTTARPTDESLTVVESPPAPMPVAEDADVEQVAASPIPPTVVEADTGNSRSTVVETVRVDIDRLDNLMNLAGELVINKARFVQIARQMGPVFKHSGIAGRTRAFGETVRRTLQLIKSQTTERSEDPTISWVERFRELESELGVLEEQAGLWEESRRCFGDITEAIDQMTRVSDSLQRGVLDTRMVPVAPLFNRFKRVVRDIAVELGKKVQLDIQGEKTELDKRMIDELGDPLVHLIRNAIDHGIEPADIRARRGKPESGTISLEAAHSGNNVFITVQDDGGGIPVDKVRKRIVDRGLVPAAAAEELTEREVLDYIWSPGFSTAEAVSDISGRGVGMDIVKTRIAELNGTIDIEHTAGRGTKFTIRLPLTLAIIRSLLFRIRHGVFACPIDTVREIVSVPVQEILTVHGRQTFEVRGEFIPLIDIDDLFDWHSVPYDYLGYSRPAKDADSQRINVVILHAVGKTIGLEVDDLQGGQDIVIKSLAENFIDIRGLSGASILGDGSVCLLLDVGAAIGLAIDSTRHRQRLNRTPVSELSTPDRPLTDQTSGTA